jgi:sugar phosphate isomerase/epimerase
MEIAAQLYTVRALTDVDFSGTIGQLAGIGYRAVELAGFGNLGSAKEVRQVLADHGVTCCASHVPIEHCEQRLDAILDDVELIGTKNLVIPWLAENRRRSAADWIAFVKTLDRIGGACQQRGVTLAYHHHAFEFEKFDGQAAFDLLWQNCDPALVKAELDVYWLRYGGADPATTIDRLRSRVVLLHLKDMAAGPDRRFAEVGSGILDWPAIFASANRANVAWGIVEQDETFQTPPLQALRMSWEFLKRSSRAGGQ